MRKIIGILCIATLLSLIIVVLGCIFYLGKMPKKTASVYNTITKTQVNTEVKDENGPYSVFVDGDYDIKFPTFEDALTYAKTKENASIRAKGRSSSVWDNYSPYMVFTGNTIHEEFDEFKLALEYAKSNEKAFIYHRKDDALIWSSLKDLKPSNKIENIALIQQKPELPQGCEVTSLAMLLSYKDVYVDKMLLEKEIKKDPTKMEIKDGVIYNGNPYYGYVGDMKDNGNFGFAVYHGPIHELLGQYLPDSSLDITGCEFEDMLYFVSFGVPVWVIINAAYDELPENAFETWHTPQGELKITYNEHSVLITGYDENYIYINDPLNRVSKTSREKFKKAWIQMGSQAVTISEGLK